MLRVRELLVEFELEVLSGQARLDEQILGVAVSDLLDPSPLLASGDLLLTSGMQLAGEAGSAAYVARLAETEIAAVGIAARAAAQPHAIRVAASDAGLPLLGVPRAVSLAVLARDVSQRLLVHGDDRLARIVGLQAGLGRTLTDRPGMSSLIEALSAALGAIVLLCDANGQSLASRSSDPLEAAAVWALRSALRERPGHPDPGPLTLPLAGGVATALRLPADVPTEPDSGSARGRTGMWLVAVRHGAELAADDLVLLRHAAPLAALELLRHRHAREQERQLAADALHAIVQGELSGDEVERRLGAFGLHGTVAAIVAQHRSEDLFPPKHLAALLAAALRREAATAVVAPAGSVAVALIPGLPDAELFEMARRIGVGIASSAGPGVCLAAGRAVPARAVGKSLEEARFALEARSMRSRRPGPRTPQGDSAAIDVATYRDLGSFQLLLALQENEALSRFCDSILGPIEAMESSYGGELLRSLQVFIEANGNWERAARQLLCHRHTLRYRIRKIEELTGRDLEGATDRIEFYLALQARAMLA